MRGAGKLKFMLHPPIGPLLRLNLRLFSRNINKGSYSILYLEMSSLLLGIACMFVRSCLFGTGCAAKTAIDWLFLCNTVDEKALVGNVVWQIGWPCISFLNA